MTIRTFAAGLLARMPPWLRRTYGKPVILALGDPLDDQAQNAANAIKLRFPTGTVDPAALSLTGAERRIPRGPDEDAATYADRLRLWLDSHRTRGGAYALLGQLFAYWRATLNVPIEVVAASGGRESMDVNGAITRDVVDWTGGGDLSTFWAQDWVFFHTPSALDVTIKASTGDEVIAGTGDVVIGSIDLLSLAGGPLPGPIEDSFSLLPRTWAPAHLKRTTIVLLYGNGRVLGYPPGNTLGDGNALGDNLPVRIVIDF